MNEQTSARPTTASGKIVISGTGRSGTTFLVQLLTALGEDTGFAEGTKNRYYENARAGMEHRILAPDLPRIVKTPHFCNEVDAAVEAGIEIAHVIIPVRDFAAAAASRRHVQMQTTGQEDGPGVNGGLVGTTSGAEQETVLRVKFTTLIEALVRHDIPLTFLAFPRMTQDTDYLFLKLKSAAFPHLEREAFMSSFRATVRPELIHTFT